MITLWQAQNPRNAIALDRKNVIGLHHFALRLTDHPALDALHEKLRHVPDVDIEFAPEALSGGNVRHMMTCIPGGIRVEFLAPGARAI